MYLLDGAGEAKMSRVVSKLVDEVVGGHEGVVDGDDLDLARLVLEGCAEDKTSDSAESVDTELEDHLRKRGGFYFDRFAFILSLSFLIFAQVSPAR